MSVIYEWKENIFANRFFLADYIEYFGSKTICELQKVSYWLTFCLCFLLEHKFMP